MLFKVPLNADPIGVRAVETITASFMLTVIYKVKCGEIIPQLMKMGTAQLWSFDFPPDLGLLSKQRLRVIDERVLFHKQTNDFD